jgi:hypothetical protein
MHAIENHHHTLFYNQETQRQKLLSQKQLKILEELYLPILEEPIPKHNILEITLNLSPTSSDKKLQNPISKTVLLHDPFLLLHTLYQNNLHPYYIYFKHAHLNTLDPTPHIALPLGTPIPPQIHFKHNDFTLTRSTKILPSPENKMDESSQPSKRLKTND